MQGVDHAVETPVVEDGGATVLSAESLGIHTALAVLLTEVDHERILLQQGRNHECWHTLAGIAGKLLTGYALLVVILEEVEHVLTDVIGLLPCRGDGVGALAATHHCAQGVVHAYLII